MDFIIFSLSTSPIISIITFIMVLLLIASLYGIKNARNSQIKAAIKYNQPEPTERNISEYKEFLKKTSAYLFLFLFGSSTLLHFFYSIDQNMKEMIELERYEINANKEVLTPYFITNGKDKTDEEIVITLTDIVKQCRSLDYSNECYIEEFSKKENYTSLFPTIPEEMLIRCLATNDCPELLVNVSTKAIDVFKEAEEQEEKEREFNRKAKWEAERPQRIEAEIGAMKILLEENQAEIKKLREELAKKSS